MNEFIKTSKEIDSKQKEWIAFSSELNDAFLKLKSENSKLRNEIKSKGLMSEDGLGYTELSRDL